MRTPQASILLVALAVLSSCDLWETQDVYLTPAEVASLEAKHGVPLDEAQGTTLKAIKEDLEELLGAQLEANKRIVLLETAQGEKVAKVTLTTPAAEIGEKGIDGLIDRIIENPTTAGILGSIPVALLLALQAYNRRKALALERGKPPAGTVTTSSRTTTTTPGV